MAARYRYAGAIGPPAPGMLAVVADDLPMVRLGVQVALEPLGIKVAAEAATGRDAVRLVEQERASLVIVGHLADVRISESVRRLKALEPSPTVVALLARTERDELAALVSFDTNGLVLRGIDSDDLATTVERVLQGERVVAPALLSALVGVGAVPGEAADEQALTTREREVLALLAAGRSNREIAAELYVTLATVKSHLQHIYAKLGASNRNEALGRAASLGLLTG